MPAKKHASPRLKTIAASLMALSFFAMGAAQATPTYNPDAASPPKLMSGMPGFTCDEPILTVSENTADPRALFAVHCWGADSYAVTPAVTVAGEVSTLGQAPYLINATYTVTDRSAKNTDDPLLSTSGTLRTSTMSLADLKNLMTGKLVWDGEHNLLSVEEQTHKWRVFSISRIRAEHEPAFINEGLVSGPVVEGKTISKVAFDHTVSRFAPKPVFTTGTVAGKPVPVLKAHVVARDGTLEVQEDETLATNRALIQEAIDKLDRNASDIQRAWALAAPARYLNLRAEVLYAEHKVAAYNPHLLEQFQQEVRQILPLTLPR